MSLCFWEDIRYEGHRHFHEREFERAVKCFSNALSLIRFEKNVPLDDVVALIYNMGVCHAELKRFIWSIQCFSRVLVMDPLHLKARLRRAEMFRMVGFTLAELDDRRFLLTTFGDHLESAREDFEECLMRRKETSFVKRMASELVLERSKEASLPHVLGVVIGSTSCACNGKVYVWGGRFLERGLYAWDQEDDPLAVDASLTYNSRMFSFDQSREKWSEIVRPGSDVMWPEVLPSFPAFSSSTIVPSSSPPGSALSPSRLSTESTSSPSNATPSSSSSTSAYVRAPRMVGIGTFLYLFGRFRRFGGSEAAPSSCIWRFDTENMTWEVCSSMREVEGLASSGTKYVRAFHSAPVYGHPVLIADEENMKVFVYGGFPDEDDVAWDELEDAKGNGLRGRVAYHKDRSSKIWMYDARSGMWSDLGCDDLVHQPEEFVGCAGWFGPNGEIFVFGGSRDMDSFHHDVSNDIHAFNIKERKWRRVSCEGDIPLAREFPGFGKIILHNPTEDTLVHRFVLYGGFSPVQYTYDISGRKRAPPNAPTKSAMYSYFSDCHVFDPEAQIWDKLWETEEEDIVGPGLIADASIVSLAPSRLVLFLGHNRHGVPIVNQDTYFFKIPKDMSIHAHNADASLEYRKKSPWFQVYSRRYREGTIGDEDKEEDEVESITSAEDDKTRAIGSPKRKQNKGLVAVLDELANMMNEVGAWNVETRENEDTFLTWIHGEDNLGQTFELEREEEMTRFPKTAVKIARFTCRISLAHGGVLEMDQKPAERIFTWIAKRVSRRLVGMVSDT